MGRIYSVNGENLTLGTGNVLVALQTNSGVAAGSRILIHRFEAFQNGTLTGAMIRAGFATRDTAGTLTTTSVTPTAIRPVTGPASGLAGNTSVIGAVARIGMNSSADSGGTYTYHYSFNFHNLNGLIWIPTPEMRIAVPPSTVWAARLLAAPTSTTGWGFTLVYEELT